MVLLAVAATVLSACVTEDDLTADQRAYSLGSELMCPVCDGQTIDQSRAPIAEDMKVIILEQIAEGRSNQDIRDYFVARYGDSILAAPEASGFNLIVWVMPVLIAGGGALAVVFVLRNMRRGPALEGASAAPSAEPDLVKYLAQVDAEIGYSAPETHESPADADGQSESP
ncbi:MAG: cytochrome c-type biogenesis protein [Planctomycetota bacterium]|jgi:cytochrome c-type biogenesis protein CcmH